MSGGLRLALPAGALFEDACRLLADAGVTDVDPSRLDRQLRVVTATATVVKMRPTDVPVYVEMGACDAGIVGKDILWESPRDCYELVDLRFGACRLVLAAPRGSPLAEGRFPQALRAATKYPVAARGFFDSLGLAVELIKLHGSVELAPAMGLADCVVDITATGRTLTANHLVEVAEAGRSTARLIANQASLKTRSEAVNQLAAALRRTVAAAAAGRAR
ncbi:MAG: ATP phosphoribosyltransferase [Candidatus Dormibacteria bacterium]